MEAFDADLQAELAGNLELIGPLGQGATASVYLAREPALQRLVALKVLRPDLAAAHARGIVHRDVRPDTVFLENRTERALLGYFGIAALVETAADAAAADAATGPGPDDSPVATLLAEVRRRRVYQVLVPHGALAVAVLGFLLREV